MPFAKKISLYLFFSLLLVAMPGRVWAQSGSSGGNAAAPTATAVGTAPASTPAAAATADVPKGTVSGKIIDKNDAAKALGDLEVMLHVLDKDQNEIGMLHGKSVKDGSYEIAGVPFQAGLGYVAAVAYEGTTYYSDLAASEAGKTSLNLDVPIYETTTDLAKVEVSQMHVLFSFSSDGMDVKQLYALSNLGDRTVKDGVAIPGKDGAKGAVQLPLPEKADFINFQPQDDARFVKVPGGFVDTAAIVPGQMSSQFVVGYLLPYSNPLTYQLKTALAVKAANFVVPKESGVTLKGTGLSDAQPVTSQDGQLFYLYKMENIPAGKTVEITFDGKPVIPQNQAASAGTTAATPSTAFPSQPLLIVGLGLFGVALIGGGAFWWVRSSRSAEAAQAEDEEAVEEEIPATDDEFERLLTEIAQLDQCFEQGEVDEATYHEQRAQLLAQAKEVQSAAGSTGAEPE